jgi:hypothetical protein
MKTLILKLIEIKQHLFDVIIIFAACLEETKNKHLPI